MDHLEPYARALRDCFDGDAGATLTVHSSLGEAQQLPAAIFFRHPSAFFPFERAALEICRGRVLDAGAGTGVHSLFLQGRGFEVTAIDILPEAVRIMTARGVRSAVRADLFDTDAGRFDTVLMLMNGIGPVGTLDGLDRFLRTAGRLLTPGGQIVVDSGEAGPSDPPAVHPPGFWPDPAAGGAGYPGEAWIRLQYGGPPGPPFRELYVDWDTFGRHAGDSGWRCEPVFRDRGAFVARLTPA